MNDSNSHRTRIVVWALHIGLVSGCGGGLAADDATDPTWTPRGEPDDAVLTTDAGADVVPPVDVRAPDAGVRLRESLQCSEPAPFNFIGTGRSEGPFSAEVVTQMAAPVGVVQWRRDLAGNASVAGQRYCTLTLISEDLGLTAGHCLSPDAKGQTFPPNVNSPDDRCRMIEVDFDHVLFPRASDGGVGSHTFRCERVISYRFDSDGDPADDWAVVRLSGSPGRQLGWGRIGRDPSPGDRCMIIGHAAGGVKSSASGPVLRATPHALLDLIPSVGGMSGSALWCLPPDGDGPPWISGIRVRGAVAGCIRDPGATVDEDDLRYTNLAVPISYLLASAPPLRNLAPAPTPPRCAGAQALCVGRCVDLQTDAVHCGGCGASCSGSQRCEAGRCVEVCDPGLSLRCDGLCVDPQTDANHCGGCGRRCTAGPMAAARCLRGACETTCQASRGDCNHSAADGCEVSLASNAQHCGACGRACALANADAACVGGACRVAMCSARFADCNARASDGCETSVATDPRNCGACGSACTAGRRCLEGRCR
jgi:hypothetical protein